MYGPPPDPRQVLAPVNGLSDDPVAYIVCVTIGMLLCAVALWPRLPGRFRALAFIAGQVTALTAPLAYHIDRYVYGAFPTIDKEGSLLFYQDGVHRRMLADPIASTTDQAAALIGVHVGHLWVSELFDLFLTPIGAFNAQGLAYIVLAWAAAALLLHEVTRNGRIAVVMAFPYGMGLHIFRDLNWYTIEKAATFFVPLYAWALLRAAERGGRWLAPPAAIFALMCWINLYLGLVCGIFAAVVFAAQIPRALRERTLHAHTRRTFIAAAASAIAALPLAAWQFALMADGPQLATPEQFLWQRAALDGFSLVPLRWNRMELLAALGPIPLAFAAVGAVNLIRDPKVQLALAAATVMFVLSIGPVLIPGEPPVTNPVYMAAREVVPGFWRVAKPEVFFHASWAMLLAVAAKQLAAWRPGSRTVAALYLALVVSWLGLTRSHPVYPVMTEPVESVLAPDWSREVFQP